MNAARGASSIIAAARSGMSVRLLDQKEIIDKKLNGRIVEIKMAKSNYGPLKETPWLFRLTSVCINNGPAGGDEFPPDDGSALLRPQGDSIGVLELIPLSEIAAGNAAAAHDDRQKVLAAVVKAMGDKHLVRQSKIIEPLSGELSWGKSLTYEALNGYLPFGDPQRVTIDRREWELIRKKPVGGRRSSPEITLRVVQAEASAERQEAA
jgi:hypothetical protein